MVLVLILVLVDCNNARFSSVHWQYRWWKNPQSWNKFDSAINQCYRKLVMNFSFILSFAWTLFYLHESNTSVFLYNVTTTLWTEMLPVCIMWGVSCPSADVNECEIYGTCPQLCRNTKGSYECFCAEGFRSVGEQPGVECAAEGEACGLLFLSFLPFYLLLFLYNIFSFSVSWISASFTIVIFSILFKIIKNATL